MKKTVLLLSLLILASCARQISTKENKTFNHRQYGNMQNMIELQNPNSRLVVYCIKDVNQTAEECAKKFEALGFVKIKNLPYKPAKYDSLHTDTYPTRRWRDGEKTPRW